MDISDDTEFIAVGISFAVLAAIFGIGAFYLFLWAVS